VRRLGQREIELVAEEMTGKTPHERMGAAQDLAQHLSCSVRQVYRVYARWAVPARTLRGDRGLRRLPITDEQLNAVKYFTVQDDLPANMAIELAELNGLIPKGVLPPETYNAWLRLHGISRRRLKRDVKPFVRWEAIRPNEIHQFDTTKLEQLHFDVATNILSWNPRANRRNSRGEKPPEVWLYLIMDDYSRAEYARLVLGSVTQYKLMDFLYEAWSKKPNPREFPFYGLPEHSYTDNGGGNQGKQIRRFYEKMQVHRIPTDPSYDKPHAARKRGKIENGFKHYNTWASLLKEGDLTWEEAQESLYRSNLKRNLRIHSDTKVAPFSRWMELVTPRDVPDEKHYHHVKHDTWLRKVAGDLTFTIDGHIYQLPAKGRWVNLVGERVEIRMIPKQYDEVFAVRGAEDVKCREVRESIVRPAFHYAQQFEPTTVETERARVANVVRHGRIKLWDTDMANPAFLPRTGQPFDTTRIAEKTVQDENGSPRLSFAPEKWRTRAQAAAWLREEGFRKRPMTEEENAWVDQLMAERGKVFPEREDGEWVDVRKISETELVEAATEFYRDRAVGEDD